MKRARVYCLLLLCCVAQGCAEFKAGFVEGQEEEAVRQTADLIGKSAESMNHGDSKFKEAMSKLDASREAALRLADESSESYGQAAEHLRKAAALAEYAGRLDLPEWGKDYHRAKAAQFRNSAEQMRLRQTQVAAFAVSRSSEEARERLGPLKAEMDKLTAESQRLQEKVSRIEAEHNIVPRGAGQK